MGYRCGVFETGGVQLSFVGTLARISFPCPGREGARGKEKEGKGSMVQASPRIDIFRFGKIVLRVRLGCYSRYFISM